MQSLLPLFEAGGVFLGFLILFIRIPSLGNRARSARLVHVASVLAVIAGILILTFQSCRVIHPGFSVHYMAVVIISIGIDAFCPVDTQAVHLLPILGACIFVFTIIVKALSEAYSTHLVACSVPALCAVVLSSMCILIHFVKIAH